MATSSEALCVRVLWGERRVATHLLRGGEQLALSNVGDVVTPGDARMAFDAASLTFHEGVTGTVLRNGETPLSLGDVVHRGLAVEHEGGWHFELGRADVVRLGAGPVEVEAFRVRAPPRAVTAWQPDYRFLNTLLICLALFLGFALHASLDVEAWEDDTVSRDMTRFRRILVKSEPPPVPVKKQAAETKEPTKTKRVAASEGSPKPPNKPTRDTGGALPDAKLLAGRIFGGPGAAGVFGPGGLGKELAGAMGGVVALNGVGNGGWSLKGNGAGGPMDQTIQIGGIARSGVDKLQGIGRLCSGPGPCKTSEGPPDIDDGTAVLCGGGPCMDKELIRKVINSHRDQIRFCYEQALQQAPSLGGKVAVQFMVNSAGTVPTARVAQSTANNQLLSDCLVSRVRGWQFPVGKGVAGYSVTYPFVFKRAGP